ncbi:CdaR family transcriptional regulator [Sporosarcina highlanderae]|uniref:Sugar diacid recognition domain-containing protein n=1 Tax=Sporosarcina highlanderae TaxID=3035916 RepID=A0ABT8JM09_9BACL|nr:sugar diacid recognition domain-containing protein [Sporosarcina highlanderae]MDN4606191.1 sugar diacid recognition domain-containing protein [Sporosarcina highlanderae]
MITKKLAEEIVEQTMVRLKWNLNVMDTNGMILASGEKERIDRIHEGAAHVVKTRQTLWITDENTADWHGTKPGVNMPIYYKDKLIGVIGVTGDPEELKDIATLVQLATEMMVHQAMITSESEWKRKIKELVFEELVDSGPLSRIVIDRLSLLEFNMTGPYLTLLVQTKNLPASPQRLIETMEEQFDKNTALIGLSKLHELFIVLSDVNLSILERKLQKIHTLFQKDSTVRIGVGLPVENLEGIVHSYETAKSAIHYGHSGVTINYYDDIELTALLKSSSPKLIERFAGRILEGLSEQLIETLEAFFEHDQAIGETAEALDIHRHTLTYRLKKVKELTSFDPTRFRDAVLFRIALLVRGS